LRTTREAAQHKAGIDGKVTGFVLPLEAIGMLLGIDRFLTMCRTATKDWSDLAGAAIIDRFCRRE
jgi:Na+/H+-dicarboxylate symporter